MLLSRKECLALRGIAILAISIHNLCHSLPNAPQENEFWFSAINNINFWSNLQIKQAFIQLFSFWGHLGVPVFVFLSGYGLAAKYHNTKEMEWKHFLWKHYKKLLIPMIIGTLIYQAVLFFLFQSTTDLLHMLLQLSLLQNLLPHSMSVFSPGPYWYFGMTMELYVLYFFIRSKHPRYLLLFAVILFAIQLFLHDHYNTLVWIKYNCLGWFFPFAMGLYAVRVSKNYSVMTCCSTLLMTSFLIPAFGFQYHLWLLIPIITPLFSISLIKLTPALLLKPLIFVGDISLYVFVMHPIVRQLIITYFQGVNPHFYTLIYILSVLCIASLAKRFVLRLQR